MTATRPTRHRLSDYPKGDVRGRAAWGRARYQEWRDTYPDRAAIVDALPKGEREPCIRCGVNGHRGLSRTKRRWDWDEDPPDHEWICNGCWSDDPFMPRADKPLDEAAKDRLRAKGIASRAVPTEANPGYRVVGNVAVKVETETDREYIERMQDLVAGDADDPPPRKGKLDDWFAHDHFADEDDEGQPALPFGFLFPPRQER